MQKMTAFPFTSKMTFDERGWPQLDRGVTSEVLRKVLKSYYTNGVFGIADSTCLQVVAATDGAPTVRVRPGVCLINGATGYTEEIVNLDLTAGDTSLPRIDTVVARLNDNTDYRASYLDIILGTPASPPQAPALTQTDSVWEIGLANLYRAANSTVIVGSNITDTRPDTSHCGYVTAIQSIDTSSLMEQLNAFYDEFVAQANTDYEVSRQQYLTQCDQILQSVRNFETATEADILDWFDRIKGIIDEDAAVHLQNEIDAAAELQFRRFYGLVTKVTNFTRNTDGSIASCREINNGESVVAETTFTRNADGSIASSQTIVTPTEGSFFYTQSTVFTRSADGSIASITDEYTKTAKS